MVLSDHDRVLLQCMVTGDRVTERTQGQLAAALLVLDNVLSTLCENLVMERILSTHAEQLETLRAQVDRLEENAAMAAERRGLDTPL